MLDLDEYERWTSENTMHIGFRRMRDLIAECRELRDEAERLKSVIAQHDVIDACLSMMRFALETVGCCCEPEKHTGTSPITYSEWIGCAIRKREKEIQRLKAKQAIDLKALDEANASNTALRQKIEMLTAVHDKNTTSLVSLMEENAELRKDAERWRVVRADGVVIEVEYDKPSIRIDSKNFGQ